MGSFGFLVRWSEVVNPTRDEDVSVFVFPFLRSLLMSFLSDRRFIGTRLLIARPIVLTYLISKGPVCLASLCSFFLSIQLHASLITLVEMKSSQSSAVSGSRFFEDGLLGSGTLKQQLDCERISPRCSHKV